MKQKIKIQKQGNIQVLHGGWLTDQLLNLQSEIKKHHGHHQHADEKTAKQKNSSFDKKQTAKKQFISQSRTNKLPKKAKKKTVLDGKNAKK